MVSGARSRARHRPRVRTLEEQNRNNDRFSSGSRAGLATSSTEPMLVLTTIKPQQDSIVAFWASSTQSLRPRRLQFLFVKPLSRSSLPTNGARYWGVQFTSEGSGRQQIRSRARKSEFGVAEQLSSGPRQKPVTSQQLPPLLASQKPLRCADLSSCHRQARASFILYWLSEKVQEGRVGTAIQAPPLSR